jgi:hypothetical protein
VDGVSRANHLRLLGSRFDTSQARSAGAGNRRPLAGSSVVAGDDPRAAACHSGGGAPLLRREERSAILAR